ncbi:MAG TPA: ATP-binding protein, partial [Longimicrobiales bacterium]
RLEEKASQEFRGLEKRVGITYLTQFTMTDLRRRLANLPPRTVVLYSTIFRDAAGNSFIPHEAAARITEVANAPVYAFVDQYIDRGVVGGFMYSIGAHAKAAAQLALGILAGADVHSLPMVEGRASSYMFDWRQLQRWRIDESLLPPGSDIRYRQLSAWDQYRRHIIAALTLAILQAAIIAALIIERANRRQSQKRYALASSAGGVGVWDWDVANNAIYVDPFLKAVLGYRDREIGNDVEDWFRLIHADDISLVAARTRSVIENQCASFEVEHRMLHRDGSIRWFLCRGSATRKNGRVLQITGTDTDITARKESDQLLGRTQEELTRVSRITALGEFAASVTHEIRQPLTAITLNVEACLAHLKDTAPRRGQMRAALRDALRATKQADDLMNRNRELFRFRTVQKEFVDINAVIENVTLLARPRLNSAQVSLVTALAPDLPHVAADRIELEHVLLNLIANAIDATQYQTPDSRRIQITSSLWEEQIEVAVRDNGVGLGSVEMDKLFTLSYTTKPTGTGIGLSLCRSILEAHGGCIWAEQNPGPGASFYFTLPADVNPSLVHSPVAKRRANHLVERSQVS